ncbi:MAG: class I SAM-dependent methyltransferase [Bryobacteraceae bacterium]
MNPAEFQHLAAAEERMWWFRGMREIFRRIACAHLAAGIRDVLDAGCGTGANAEWMDQTFGWRVWGLEFAEEGLRHARRRSPLRVLAGGDIRRLPFTAGSFDLITCFDVFAHLEPGEEREAMREMARCLRPGGRLFIRAAAFRWLRSRHSQFVGEKQRFTLAQLKRAAAEAGLELRFTTYANSLLLPAALVKFRLLEPLMRAPVKSGVALGPEWLESLLRSVLRLEAWWIGRGGRFPAGQSAILLARKPR